MANGEWWCESVVERQDVLEEENNRFMSLGGVFVC